MSVKSGERCKMLEDRADRAADQRDQAYASQQQANTQFRSTAEQFTALANDLAATLRHITSMAYPDQASFSEDMIGGEIAQHLARIISRPGECTSEDYNFLRQHWNSEWREAIIRDDGVTLEQVVAFARHPDTPFEVNAVIHPTLPAYVRVPSDPSALNLTHTGYMRAING